MWLRVVAITSKEVGRRAMWDQVVIPSSEKGGLRAVWNKVMVSTTDEGSRRCWLRFTVNLIPLDLSVLLPRLVPHHHVANLSLPSRRHLLAL